MNLLGYIRAYGTSEGVKKEWDERGRGQKLKWRVDPPSVGRYSSFEKRNWPTADYADGRPALRITSEDEYRPSDVKTGNHKELTVFVADWAAHNAGQTAEKGAFKWRALQARFSTLQEAKAAGASFVEKHPEFAPKKENQ